MEEVPKELRSPPTSTGLMRTTYYSRMSVTVEEWAQMLRLGCVQRDMTTDEIPLMCCV